MVAGYHCMDRCIERFFLMEWIVRRKLVALLHSICRQTKRHQESGHSIHFLFSFTCIFLTGGQESGLETVELQSFALLFRTWAFELSACFVYPWRWSSLRWRTASHCFSRVRKDRVPFVCCTVVHYYSWKSTPLITVEYLTVWKYKAVDIVVFKDITNKLSPGIPS